MKTCNTLEWRIRVMMAERHIKTITELRKQLETVGVEISTAQLSRVVDALPTRISSDLLAGLTTVLRCNVGDLVRVTRHYPAPGIGGFGYSAVTATESRGQEFPDNTPPSTSRRRRMPPPKESLNAEDMTGPMVTALPIPDRGKR